MKQLTAIILMACAGVSLWGQDAAAYLRQADTQAKAGQYKQAVDNYRKVTLLDPGNSQAYMKLGDIYTKLNMPDEAATAYEKAADLLTAPAAAPAQPHTPGAANRPAPAAPPATAGNSGGVNGLYFMTRFWVSSGLEIATYRFQNGTVVRNPIASDLQAERATHANDVGTYQLQGGQLLVAVAGSNHTARFEPMDHGCFGWDAGIFCPAEVFKPGTTLEGTFEGGASVGGGALMASTMITFKRDGTYQCGTAVSFSSVGRTTAVAGGSTTSERGKYRIDGPALHMTPEGGQESVYSTFPWDDHTPGPAPQHVYLGGRMMNRLK